MCAGWLIRQPLPFPLLLVSVQLMHRLCEPPVTARQVFSGAEHTEISRSSLDFVQMRYTICTVQLRGLRRT